MLQTIKKFISTESNAGDLLMVSALAALFAANMLPSIYESITHYSNSYFSLHVLVNDILMTLFFLVIGLEIKREIAHGELSNARSALLPVIAAIGGMSIPAMIYLWITASSEQIKVGWAIPTATDIAFSLGVLTLIGKGVPSSLKVFLTGLAIIDDLLAILIIAFCYTTSISWIFIAGVILLTAVLIVLNRKNIGNLFFYLSVAPFLIWCMFRSGIHCTIAGVIFAFCIPLRTEDRTPLMTLERKLHPWVAYLILPLFAFCNAGVDLRGITLEQAFSSLSIAIATGLFFGKQIGVFGTSYFAIRCGLATLPKGSTWAQLYGISLLTGIGFTMSLFIGMLSFTDPVLLSEVKIGVMAGSFFSAVLGFFVVSGTLRQK